MQKTNVVTFPLNGLAQYRDSVRNPKQQIPDELLKQANAELDQIENSGREKEKR